MMARKMALGRFCVKKVDVFVVIDVVVCGIDIFLFDNVINYDFFVKGKLFVYRVGCVARVGRIGNAYSFFVKEEFGFLVDLYLFFGCKIVVVLKVLLSLIEEVFEIVCKVEEFVMLIIGICFIGAFDMFIDRLREVMKAKDEFEGLECMVNNVYRLY